MYSSGIPILYPIACFFYAVLYWVYKILLLKFYQKTYIFDEELAIFSLKLIKYGLLFHMVIAAFMLTNSKILSSAKQ